MRTTGAGGGRGWNRTRHAAVSFPAGDTAVDEPLSALARAGLGCRSDRPMGRDATDCAPASALEARPQAVVLGSCKHSSLRTTEPRGTVVAVSEATTGSGALPASAQRF